MSIVSSGLNYLTDDLIDKAVINPHDDAKPHIAKIVKTALLVGGFSAFTSAPMDYRFFCSMPNEIS